MPKDKARGPYKNSKQRWVAPGTLCGCGCDATIPERKPDGTPRRITSPDGKVYLPHHHLHNRKGNKHPRWKGRYLNTAGYVVLRMPDHHLADSGGMVLEHRLIWEQANGRLLQSDEDVHHLNGKRTDNRPENLAALSHVGHLLLREQSVNALATTEQLSNAGKKGSRILNLKRWGTTPEEANETLTCAYCGKVFIAWKKRQRRYCSRECGVQGRFGKHPDSY